MLILILGIIVFLGTHTFTTFRDRRERLVEGVGENAFKLIYSAVALGGFVLIIWGFSLSQAEGQIPLWTPPTWGRHAAMLLMWFSFVALAASGKKPGRIRGWLRHPMLVGVKFWALAHLLANGDLGGLLLFGSFLAWAVYDRIAVKRRGDPGASRVPAFTRADGIALIGGTVAYVAMIFLHPVLIGVPVLR
jgi:uncharacterized membrane protein